VHADLKPENLMLSSWDPENSALKVVDFGCSLPDGCEVVSHISTVHT
jgi:serine/threonine protein kinase